MKHRKIYIAAVLTVIAALAIFQFREPGKDSLPFVKEESRHKVKDRLIMSPDLTPNLELREIPSEEPRLKKFVDSEGRLAKTIRLDEYDRVIRETELKDGQEESIERVFDDQGKLMRERHLRNGVMTKEDIFR